MPSERDCLVREITYTVSKIQDVELLRRIIAYINRIWR